MEEPTFIKVFGVVLRNIRTARGWSQTELARAARVPQSDVSAWERGDRTLTSVKLAQLMSALDLDIMALLRMMVVACDLLTGGEEADQIKLPSGRGAVARRAAAAVSEALGMSEEKTSDSEGPHKPTPE